jgi:hypothetical protein
MEQANWSIWGLNSMSRSMLKTSWCFITKGLLPGVGNDYLATIKLQATKKNLSIKNKLLRSFPDQSRDGEIFHDSLSPIGP